MGEMKTEVSHYTYSVEWSDVDGEFVATVAEFPSLSWLDEDQLEALRGLRDLVDGVVEDMTASGEQIPLALGSRQYSGKFNVRVRPAVHRQLVVQAAKDGVSLNRLVSDLLARS